MKERKSNIPVSRRNLLKYGGGFLGTGALAILIGDLIDKKQLKVVGNYYDLDTETVSLLS